MTFTSSNREEKAFCILFSLELTGEIDQLEIHGWYWEHIHLLYVYKIQLELVINCRT